MPCEAQRRHRRWQTEMFSRCLNREDACLEGNKEVALGGNSVNHPGGYCGSRLGTIANAAKNKNVRQAECPDGHPL